jgi:hypothetical protein
MKRNASVVLHTPEPGSGAGRYVYELTRALASEGWQATLLAPDNFEYRNSLGCEKGVEFSPLGTRANEGGRALLSRTADNLLFVLKACWVAMARITCSRTAPGELRRRRPAPFIKNCPQVGIKLHRTKGNV